MALAPGSRVGSFEILAPLGRGGMGEVWRARDTKLKREVAVKALPAEFAADPERRARFEREAHLLAALNHPNIAAIYGLEEAGDAVHLVLELVPGQTLDEKLAAGPLPVPEAASIATQIAAALEAAHAAGVIHRDLKPSNVKVRPDGSVKVLDFGLARLADSGAVASDASASPTITTGGTRSGVILGTAAYMSPEQARGRPLDKRTDIFSFGCVLYECLTGRRTFGGETVSDTLAAILTAEPDWKALPAEAPPRLQALLRRCLRKDPHRRLHDIADARLEIEEALEEPPAPPLRPVRASRRDRLVFGVEGLLLGALAALLATRALRLSRPAPTPTVPVRATLTLPAGTTLRAGPYQPSMVFSPDGKRLVVGLRDGKARLYVRSLDGTETRPVPGTEAGFGPFFSPDGEWLAFFTGRELKKVALAGGAPLTLCEVPPVTQGGAWAPDGWIYFTIVNGGLRRVRSSGGIPEIFTTPDQKAGERAHVFPQVLPGGKELLVIVRTGKDFQEFERSNVAVLDIASRRLRTVLQGVSFGLFAPPGHLIFTRGGSVLAVPCDPRTFEPSGPHFALPGDMMVADVSRVPFLASSGRTIVFAVGEPERLRRSTLVWVDRTGREEPLLLSPAVYETPILSPDGRSVALSVTEGARQSIFAYDIARDVLSPVLPEAGRSFNQTWTPDSRRIVYTSFQEGWPRLYWKPADGSGSPEALSPGEVPEFPSSVSPDGKTLAYTAVSTRNDATDIWLLGLDGKRDRRAWITTPFKEYSAFFSPDGGLIAYTVEESGQKPEVYVRPYPGPEGRIKISGSEGGAETLWSPDGSELFYRTESEQLMAVKIVRSPTLSASTPHFVLDTKRYLSAAGEDSLRQYDISRDGKRFLFIKPGEVKRQAVAQLELVMDWPGVFGRTSSEKR